MSQEPMISSSASMRYARFMFFLGAILGTALGFVIGGTL